MGRFELLQPLTRFSTERSINRLKAVEDCLVARDIALLPCTRRNSQIKLALGESYPVLDVIHEM